MTDRPIIFSAPMVKALIAGRKSQTRRILKPQPNYLPGRLSSPHRDDDGQWVQTVTYWRYNESFGNYEPEQESNVHLRLRYATGYRLYVREACGWLSGHGWQYRADAKDLSDYRESGCMGKWRPPIHMPRTASRLTLTVTDVRVQRLNEISEADAKAEGVLGECAFHVGNDAVWRTPFRDLWNTIHDAEAWDANPWVVALTFDVRHGNIDSLESP